MCACTVSNRLNDTWLIPSVLNDTWLIPPVLNDTWLIPPVLNEITQWVELLAIKCSWKIRWENYNIQNNAVFRLLNLAKHNILCFALLLKKTLLLKNDLDCLLCLIVAMVSNRVILVSINLFYHNFKAFCAILLEQGISNETSWRSTCSYMI